MVRNTSNHHGGDRVVRPQMGWGIPAPGSVEMAKNALEVPKGEKCRKMPAGVEHKGVLERQAFSKKPFARMEGEVYLTACE